ncbi:hypothetical protein [Luteibacter sp. E-22]|uniref:hypothetical protein n=1 Tax=Luteibacter sp. E-22 TaxID=3404050 RepID=UPI003CF7A99B
MTMTISEALSVVEDVSSKIKSIGLPVWSDALTEATSVIRSRLEVTDEMATRVLVHYYGGDANPALLPQMKAALVAALGDEHDRT